MVVATIDCTKVRLQFEIDNRQATELRRNADTAHHNGRFVVVTYGIGGMAEGRAYRDVGYFIVSVGVVGTYCVVVSKI